MSTAVIDTNILIHATPQAVNHNTLLTTPAVTAELQSSKAKHAFDTAAITITEPKNETVEHVRETSNTANLDLSQEDIELIALALEKDATLVTDDRFMQETAHRLDIEVDGVQREPVTDTEEWTWICKRCRTELGTEKQCPKCNGDPIRVS